MSNLTLFALAAEYRALAEKLADMECDPQVIADTLEGESGALETKAANVVMVARSLEALAGAIKAEEESMAARRKALDKRAGWLREYVLQSMQACGMQKIEAPQFRISVRANPEAVDVFDAAQVPAAFMRQPEPPPPAIDKTAIKKALAAGQDVPGARLVRGHRLEIK